MKRYALFLVVLCLGGLSHAANQPATGAVAVVTKFYQGLRAGDVGMMDPLFFRIPVMESSRADWLKLLEKVAQKVEDEQLDWDVVCGKELTDVAAVIVNQTMKYGKKHADPDAMYLVKEDDRWLLLPDALAPNARDEVRSELTQAQVMGLSTLHKWAVSEIRGLSSECQDSIEIVDFGIYTSDRADPQLLTMTDEVPATVGTVFGIRVLAADGRSGDYDFRWSFPEMQNPDSGQVWTEMTGTRGVTSGQPQSFLVRINNDWEAKTGAWTVQLSRAGRVIVEKSFRVYDP